MSQEPVRLSQTLYDPTPRFLQDSPANARHLTNNFARNYRDFSFETMKQRHDNLNFGKAIMTKQAQHDTLHFQNNGQFLRTSRPPDVLVLQKSR